MPSFPPASPQRPRIKVCGLTRAEDALLAIELGADFLGLILTAKSPRHLPAERARELVTEVRAAVAGHGQDARGTKGERPGLRFVGVFVDESPAEIAALREALDLFAVQVHGTVSDLYPAVPADATIPAVAVRGAEQAAQARGLLSTYPAVLADAFSATAHGGTGKVFDHAVIQPVFKAGRVFIAGGLNPDNIREVVQRLSQGPLPYAFDLSSGLEAEPGVKDPEKVRAFFANYNAALAGGAAE